LADVVASPRAIELAAGEVDPREIEVILSETERIVRMRPPFIVSETRHGLICGSAGVDHSNSGEDDVLVLLPEDPDSSARALREGLREQGGVNVAVIVADSFGRPFRMGTTDVAIGVAGLAPIRDLRGTHDRDGRELRSTLIAVADELASAADLARRKESGVPVVIVRGFPIEGDGSAQDLIMPRERSLFD
jgi:coenzyme F420-0:L-glutamate ligase/coenzyme F420-1:gamma-L-glutamate ligase